MNSVAEFLIQARDRISDPHYWCQEYFIKNLGSGEEAYCAIGALSTCGINFSMEFFAQEFLEQASHCLHGVRVVVVNDLIGHQAVMTVYDEAIRLAKEYENYMSGELA